MLRSRGRNPDKRYVNTKDTSLESEEAQTAATDPLIQGILRRLSKVESILSTLLGQAYDSSGTEGLRITLPDLLSRVVKLDEAADSALCEADTTKASNTSPIEETTSLESLINISAYKEVLPEAIETLQGPAIQPYAWRTRQKKKKGCRRPPIVFESAEFEIETHSGTFIPLS